MVPEPGEEAVAVPCAVCFDSHLTNVYCARVPVEDISVWLKYLIAADLVWMRAVQCAVLVVLFCFVLCFFCVVFMLRIQFQDARGVRHAICVQQRCDKIR